MGLLAVAAGGDAGVLAAADRPARIAAMADRRTGDVATQRLLVLTDIGNEPDDQMSLVRLLLYSNTIDIEGLVATTSIYMRDRVNPGTIHDVVGGYARVRPMLLRHASGWPRAEVLDSLVAAGHPAYGMASVTGGGVLSSGARAIIAAADRHDPRPLWISIWGGAVTLAEALDAIRRTRPAADVDRFVATLRVYAISDQDDAGAWIRRNFPALFYIVSPTSQDSDEYAYATWTGISGDVLFRNGEGADTSLVTNAWLDTHIRHKGPLSDHYPRFEYIMEGDSPAFLGLIPNGLNNQAQPDWGGWGGRYVLRTPRAESRPIWTQGGEDGSRTTSRDAVVGIDGRVHVSDQATIWRWRRAFQNDFAARMDWTSLPYAKANHPPTVAVDGDTGLAPVARTMRVGQTITLDASASVDPDRQQLSYRWYAYPEAAQRRGRRSAAIALTGAESSRVAVRAERACEVGWNPGGTDCDRGEVHLVLEVTDSGTPALTRYRRVVITVGH